MRHESPDPAPDDGTGDWHARPAAAVLAALEAGAEGLTDEEAARRHDRWGPNRLPEPERQGALMRFVRQFHNLLISVLIVVAAMIALFVAVSIPLIERKLEADKPGYAEYRRRRRALLPCYPSAARDR